MRKGAQYFSHKQWKGRFLVPKFWPLSSNCAPNFEQIPPPLNKHMLIISKEYLDSCKSYCWLMKNFLSSVAYLSRETVNFIKGRPLDNLNFRLISNNFYMNQDIAMKFSTYVYYMSVLNWPKIFWHHSIRGPVAHPSLPKIQMLLVTMFVEIFFLVRF